MTEGGEGMTEGERWRGERYETFSDGVVFDAWSQGDS